MSAARYKIKARWWTGLRWETVEKEAWTKDDCMGALSLLLREVRPYQISVTDIHQQHPEE